LVLILFVSLVGILCGAKDWEEIVQCAEGMIDWISRYVDTSHGVPSSFTLRRVMGLIPTTTLSRLLECLRSSIQDFKGDVIAFDGKTLRGSRGWSEQDCPLHLLHAWSTEHGLCLGQVTVNEKSNEITAVPELIEALEIKGATITADALNTQKTIVTAIIKKGADYVLPVKNNHKDLHDDIEVIFNEADKQAFKGFDSVQTQTLEKSAGRIEERFYDLIDAEDLPEREKWAGCRSIGRVIRKRAKGRKSLTEVCFYITSLELEAERFSKAVREHWGVENGLHLPLDVVFEEDKHRYQNRVGVANLSLLRKIGLAILSREVTLKCGKSAKQMRAATSAVYRDHLLKNCF
jgi:predicted transposase YbfD/YdcC